MLLALTCQRDTLHNALKLVARGVTGRSAQPVQNNVHLEVSDGYLHLAATDLELLSVETAVAVEGAEPGSVTVPGKLLAEIIASLPDSPVTLEATEVHHLVVRCEGIEETVRGLDAADFQRFQVVDGAPEYTLPQRQLRRAIDQVVFAASGDQTRPILTGVLMEVGPESLSMTATDTYRMANLQHAGGHRHGIVPSRVLDELFKLLSADSDQGVMVRLSDALVSFETGGVTISSRLIEGVYPNYHKVIPDTYERVVTVDAAALTAALRRAIVVAKRAGDYRVKLAPRPGALQVAASAPDVGTFSETLEADLEGEPLEAAFNGRYLMDAITAVGVERVRLELRGPMSPVALRAGEYLHVLMPMEVLE